MGTTVGSVLIAGCGVMGRGILATFVAAGFACRVKTLDAAEPGPGIAGVPHAPALPEEAPDLIVETIWEDFDAKVALYREIEAKYAAPPGPIIASNTSGLSLQAMARTLARPERFLGVHYFHPAELFPVVEAIRVAETGTDAFEAACAALARTGKEPVRLLKPLVGGLVNRLQHAILHEAYHLIESGAASVEDVDKVAKRLLGPRMCATGLIEQKDLGGLAVHARAQQSIVPALHRGREPARLVADLVRRGHLGVSTGRGFYDWGGRDAGEVRRRAAQRLARILAAVEA